MMVFLVVIGLVTSVAGFWGSALWGIVGGVIRLFILNGVFVVFFKVGYVIWVVIVRFGWILG